MHSNFWKTFSKVGSIFKCSNTFHTFIPHFIHYEANKTCLWKLSYSKNFLPFPLSMRVTSGSMFLPTNFSLQVSSKVPFQHSWAASHRNNKVFSNARGMKLFPSVVCCLGAQHWLTTSSRPTLPSLRSLPLSALLHPAWEAARPSTRASRLGTHWAQIGSAGALTSLPSPTHKHRRPTQCYRSTRAQTQQLFNDVMCHTSEGAQAEGKCVGVCVGRPVHRSMRALADFDTKIFNVHLQFD